MPLSAPEYWLEWAKNYFRCQFTYVGELIHKETWSAASFGWAEGLQTINPPIYRLTTAVSDIDQTNINRDIRDGNWLSSNDPIWNGHRWLKTWYLGIGYVIGKAKQDINFNNQPLHFHNSHFWFISLLSLSIFLATSLKRRKMTCFICLGWNIFKFY